VDKWRLFCLHYNSIILPLYFQFLTKPAASSDLFIYFFNYPPLRLKCVGLPQFEPGCPFASAALEDSNLEGQAKLSRGQIDGIWGWLLYP
jgi:hypothetical protein